MTAPPLFSARLIAGWLAGAALALAGSFFLLTRSTGPAGGSDQLRPTIYSTSALGYAALYHTLSRLDIPVAEGRASQASLNGGAVVVIAEPDRDERALAHVRAALREVPALVLVLPKRRGVAAPNRPDRLVHDELLPAADVGTILALADSGATLTRPAGAGPWYAKTPLPPIAPVLRSAQLVRSLLMRPLLAAPEGILIGEIDRDDRRLIVISDPDILENHGLARGDNAIAAATVMRTLRAGRSGRVVFDEAVHGFVSRRLGAFGLLLGFPFVLVTLQIAIAGALLIWAGSGRFGAPVARAPALAAGKASLIESGARLLEYAGAPASLTARYREAIERDVAQRLQAPRGLGAAELRAWFDRTGRPAPLAPAGPLHDVSAAAADARAVYRWRNDVLDES